MITPSRIRIVPFSIVFPGAATIRPGFVVRRLSDVENDVAVVATFGKDAVQIWRPKQAAEWIEMDFPVNADEPADAPPGLGEALGAALKYVGRNKFDYIVEVESETALRNLKPNFTLLAEIPVRGVIVTARSETAGFDFVSRFFAPASGVNEDPVTGSAHCCLAPFWAKRLGKKEFTAYQASPRGGVVRVRLNGD